MEAARCAVLSQEGRPSKGKLAVIISSLPQNQNDDEEKTHCGGGEFKRVTTDVLLSPALNQS